MNTKTVHAYDAASRLYMGPVVLDESDLSPLEPGVFLIPGNCLEAQPPAPEPGKVIAELRGAWVLLEAPAAPEPAPEAAPVVEHTPPAASSETPPVEQPLTLEQQVQRHMELTAKAWGYDSLMGGISYADEESVPLYAAQGRALRAWRSKVWEAFYGLQAKLAAGDLVLDNEEAILPMLPALEMPRELPPKEVTPEAAQDEVQAVADPVAPVPAKATTRTNKKKG